MRTSFLTVTKRRSVRSRSKHQSGRPVAASPSPDVSTSLYCADMSSARPAGFTGMGGRWSHSKTEHRSIPCFSFVSGAVFSVGTRVVLRRTSVAFWWWFVFWLSLYISIKTRHINSGNILASPVPRLRYRAKHVLFQ
jgi:hypothetical protein